MYLSPMLDACRASGLGVRLKCSARCAVGVNARIMDDGACSVDFGHSKGVQGTE